MKVCPASFGKNLEESDVCEGRHKRVRPDRPEYHASRTRRQEYRLRGGQRSDQRRDPRASVEIRLGTREPPREDRGEERHDFGRRRRVQGAVAARSGSTAVEVAGRRCGVRVHRSVHQSRRCGQAPHRRRQEGGDYRARQRPRHHARPGGQRREVQPGDAPDPFQRVVHDELSGAGRKGHSSAISVSRRVG